MNSQRIWAIIGGGNGGQTMAGHLGVMGERVRLFDVVQSTVDKINETKKINLHHAIEGVGEIEFATTDISQALDKADNVIVVLPTIYHDSIAEKMAPYLKDGQVILLHPESCCGAIAFRLLLERLNCRAKVVVGCVSNLLYATRATQPGEVYVHSVKRSVNIAAIPATDNQRLYDAVGDKFPQLKLTDHVLKISLDNTNALMHPGPVILNAGRIEAVPHVPFEYYREGVTPSIGKVIHALDAERRAIANALGFEQRTINEAYQGQYNYGPADKSIDEIVSVLEDYKGITAPTSLDTRYIHEDVPYNLVPMSALGDIVGVDTPCTDALITLGQIFADKTKDTGRTAENMGIDRMDKDTLMRYVVGE